MPALVTWQGRPRPTTTVAGGATCRRSAACTATCACSTCSCGSRASTGSTRPTGRTRAADLLEQLGLADRGKDKIQDLSGGMAQRVQLAAAMVHEPDAPRARRAVRGARPRAPSEFLSDVIRDHVRSGRNLLFSSHQLDLVEDLCETITLINHGRVVLHGDVRELKASSHEPLPPRRRRRRPMLGWIGRQASVISRDASGSRVRLAPGVDAGRRPRRRPGPRRRAATSAWSRRACPSCSSPPPASGSTTPTRRRVTRWKATRLVAGRELHEALRRRSFWIILAVLFAASTAAVMLPEVIGGGGTTYSVAVVGGTPTLDRQLEAVAEQLDVELDAVDRDLAVGRDPARRRRRRRRRGRRRRPPGGHRQGRPGRLARGHRPAGGRRPGARRSRSSEAGLTQAEVDGAPCRARRPGSCSLAEDESSRRGSAFIVSIVLYLLLLMLMIQVANGTAIEKANRISEVLLAIVRPGALLFGKVLGVGHRRVRVTLLVGLLPVAREARCRRRPARRASARRSSAARPWFLLGVALYLTTAGALGALVERQEEAGSVVSPLTFLLIGTYLVAQSASDTVARPGARRAAVHVADGHADPDRDRGRHLGRDRGVARARRHRPPWWPCGSDPGSTAGPSSARAAASRCARCCRPADPTDVT